MRAVLQRVRRARVQVGGETVGSIGPGLLVLLAVEKGDGSQEVEWMARKVAELRIFPDAEGRMNLSLLDLQKETDSGRGEVLAVSQFTLAARVKKGRRPSFTDAASPEEAERRFDAFTEGLAERGLRVATGRFGAMMEVELVNDGPVTIILERRGGAE